MDSSIIILFIGLALIITGLMIRRKLAGLHEGGREAEGVVNDFERDGDNRFPVVRFQTPDKKWITAKSNMSYLPTSLEKGAKVRLVYNPDNPENFYILSRWTTVMPKIFLILGVLMTIAGILMLIGISEEAEHFIPAT